MNKGAFHSNSKSSYTEPTIRHVLLKKTLFHLTTFKKHNEKIKHPQISSFKSMEDFMCQGLPCTPKSESNIKSCKNVKGFSTILKPSECLKYKPNQCPLEIVKKKRNTIYVRQPSYILPTPFEVDTALKGKTIDARCSEYNARIGMETEWNVIWK